MVLVRVYPKVRLCITLVDPQIDEHRYFLGYPKDSRTLKLFVRFITRSITVDPLHFKCLHCGVLGRVDVVSCVLRGMRFRSSFFPNAQDLGYYPTNIHQPSKYDCTISPVPTY